MNNQKKTILLGIPNHFSFHKVFKDQLSKHDFDVVDLSGFDEKFRYKNLWQRLNNLYRKLILKDYEFKKKLKQKAIEAFYERRLATVPSVDYALIIRADLFPISTILQIKKLAKSMVGYQWDGLSRFPEIHSRINFFDRFFVFDPADVALPSRLPISNFYIEDDALNHEDVDTDILFIGTFMEKRMQDIYRFFNMLGEAREIKVKALINVTSVDDRIKMKTACSTLTPYHNGISYYENLSLANKSRILVDFTNYLHNGLSFRVFEAIGLNKKLITNQKSIMHYDFYNPHNILVIDANTDHESITTFLKTPYENITEEIKQKYGFRNWINYALKKDDYISIDLPNISDEPSN